MKLLYVILLILISSAQSFGQQNWFDNELAECIVSLEKKAGDTLIFHGTGFLMYDYKREGKRMYIVTCEHVLRNSNIFIRFPTSQKFINNNKSNKNRIFLSNGQNWFFDGSNVLLKYPLIKDSTFFINKDLDIGILSVASPETFILDRDTINMISNTSIPRSLTKMKKGVDIGTEIYFLGFPFQIGTVMGAGGKYSNEISAPLLRTGTIAWKTDVSNEFLLDAFSYGGNSGSPIFSKRDVLGGQPYLIGMVVGHLNDPTMPKGVDINIGLARCVWIDDILELINEIEKK